MKIGLILANQLFQEHPVVAAKPDHLVMIEARDVSSRHRYHQQKLALLFAGMRHFAQAIESQSLPLTYTKVEEAPHFCEALQNTLQSLKATELVCVCPADIPTEQRITKLCGELKVTVTWLESPGFITSLDELDAWMQGHPKSTMETFYRFQRQRTGYLLEGQYPAGGRWNFDTENREPLPKGGIEIPTLPTLTRDDITQSAVEDVRSIFKNHPGDAQLLWLPVTHQAAKEWLETFLAERLEQFGRYEDAMKFKEPVLFHSALSSLMNCGLLTPQYVVERVLQAYESGNAPLAAVEGFVRQVIGWREYMYGRYRLQRQELLSANYFGFTKQLETWWYGDEQIPASLLLPVRDALEKTIRYGYAHHIERLMILGNWFLLNQYDPKSVYEWFLSMYTDAYEWVMVGNVMGMSQYADGGGIATKPYISGGNYLQTMGRFWSSAKVARESEFTVKYWQFVESNYDKLKNNHRMSLVLKRISPKR